ncbi:dihydrofolate reductase [bacterium]|nr:MAG: dihydrofolate reductase [bacterium]
MQTSNKVFIGRSLDGYIADRNNGLAWLDMIPNPDGIDMGYYAFMETVDAILMGRVTFDTVCGFDIEWPFKKPVFVLSSTLNEIPEKYSGKVQMVKGDLPSVLKTIHEKGFHHLYIDGGKTIQSLLNEDLIDEIIVTTIPILLGGGSSLFGAMPHELQFDHVHTQVFLNHIVQSQYKRKRG